MMQRRPVKKSPQLSPTTRILLVIIVALVLLAIWLLSPSGSSALHRDKGDLGLRLGLDLKGGTQLLYQADANAIVGNATLAEAMDGVKKIIENRVDAYGVTEPVVQIQGTDKILVQLPGVTIDEAQKLVGQMAKLDFRENPSGDGTTWVIATDVIDGQTYNLTGEYLKPNAKVQLVGTTGTTPEVAIEFTDLGATMFYDVTYRNWHKSLAIFLDDQLISAPTVLPDSTTQEGISGGKAIISGKNMDINACRTLALQLNAGAMPIPLGSVDPSTGVFQAGDPLDMSSVDPTLGADFVHRAVVGGIIGLLIVMLFMILYYRGLGGVACIALVIYAVLVLAIFKLIPVTLTLAGIGGFVVSLGMAVDANVLIFERMKEELRAGRTLGAAIEAGFDRAWSAIRDSNITTFIACIVLYWFGGHIIENSQVKGFALTLFIGVAVSMFTAITVSHMLLRVSATSQTARRLLLPKTETKEDSKV
jgi:preprotein translocase subunit SecD